jgi:rhomboid protease GluP
MVSKVKEVKPNQRQSILCPNCRKLISRNESQCPYCALKRPGSFWNRLSSAIGLKHSGHLIRSVVAVNIAFFLISLLLSSSRIGMSMNPLVFLSPDNDSLILLGMTGTIPIDRFGRWWSLVSANYLHGGILHIFFNMAAFTQLASLAVREFGTYRMFIIYTVGGMAGFLVSYFAGIAFTIGASAAICSLIGAILYYGKSRGGVYGQVIYRQVGSWAIGLFIFGLLIPGINNWGHIGGGIAGVLLGLLLGYQEKKRENQLHRLLAGLCVSITIAILGYALVTGLLYRLMP